MKTYRSYLLLTSLLCLLFACENEIPFNFLPQEPELVVNAVLEAGKKENLVYLHIITDKKTKQVENGSVTVYVNDEKKEVAEARVMAWIKDEYIKYCTLSTLFLPGDRVRLEATAEDGRYQASAEVQMPQPLEEAIRVDTLLTRLKVGYYVEPCMRFHITLKDRPGEKNYYRLILEENDNRFTPFEPEIINQEDIVLTDGHLSTADDKEFGFIDMAIRNDNNIFTDSRFLNTSYTLNIYTNLSRYYNFDKDEAVAVDTTIRLLCITKEYYRYLRAMNCLNSNDYNAFFMEPVIIPCNIQGGLGFVGASTDQQVSIRIIDWQPYQHPAKNTININ